MNTNIPKYMVAHFFRNVNPASFERLAKWAYSRLEVNENEWNKNDFIHQLRILGAKHPQAEFQYWFKKKVIVPTLKQDYFIFGNMTLQHFLIAKQFNEFKEHDDLIDRSSTEPWGSILCHLIWIQEEEKINDIIKELTKIIPNHDGGVDKNYLKRSEEFLDNFYDKLPVSSRNRLRDDLRNSFQYFPQRIQKAIALFKIHVSYAPPDNIVIRNVTNNTGLKGVARLPYSSNTLRSLLKILNEGAKSIENDPVAMDNLTAAGLVKNNRIVSNYLELIGKRLYDVVFSNSSFPEFFMARKKDKPVVLELLFDHDDVILSQLPWELMFDGEIPLFVANHEVYLVRSLASNTGNNDFDSQQNVSYLSTPKVLSVHPRPIGPDKMPAPEKAILKKLSERLWFEWKESDPPRWKSMLEIVQSPSPKFNIFHFDGHGTFGRLCAQCDAVNDPLTDKCWNCSADISSTVSDGYLDFEDDTKNRDRVKVMDLKVLFANSGFQIGVISACRSAEIEGLSVFNGIAPGLIQAGFQAVIGMQGSPTVGVAAKFLDTFYNSLASGYPVYQAVTSGRLEIFREKPVCWFVPVLYMQENSLNKAQPL